MVAFRESCDPIGGRVSDCSPYRDEQQFNSIQFNCIYIAPKQYNCLKVLYRAQCLNPALEQAQWRQEQEKKLPVYQEETLSRTAVHKGGAHLLKAGRVEIERGGRVAKGEGETEGKGKQKVVNVHSSSRGLQTHIFCRTWAITTPPTRSSTVLQGASTPNV